MTSDVVVGASLSGLSAACHLTRQGHEVTVVEREAIPGGRAGRLTRDGFRFDSGPTVLTMPDLIADPLRVVGAELGDVLSLQRLNPPIRAWFAAGTTIDIRFSAAKRCGTRSPASAAA